MVLAAFIISILALIVAVVVLPTAFQMIGGRPKIIINFEDWTTITGKQDRVLQCDLQNEPIRWGILHWLGVRRMTADDVSVRFLITEEEGRKPIFNGLYERVLNSPSGTESRHISLPPSIASASFGIVEVKKGKVMFRNEGNDFIFIPKGNGLKPGIYSVIIFLLVDGNETQKEKNFVVTKKPPFAYW